MLMNNPGYPVEGRIPDIKPLSRVSYNRPNHFPRRQGKRFLPNCHFFGCPGKLEFSWERWMYR